MEKTIAYITDIHLDEQFPIDHGIEARKNWEIILADIASRQIDEVIFGGDIGEKPSNKWFFDSLNKYAENLKITLGNHDSYSEVKKYYSNKFVKSQDELYYNYEDNLYKYFFLDSSSSEISIPQLEWLKNGLLVTDKKPIVFIHHPILKVNTPIDKEFPLTNRDTFKELLLLHKQDILIFCGHYHMEDETRMDNIKQYITPASSYQIVNEADKIEINAGVFGYRLIYIDKEQITTEVILHDNKNAVI